MRPKKGDVFGRLTLIEDPHPEVHKRRRRWVVTCACTCGNEKSLPTNNMTHGGTRSCGCLRSETSKKNNFKHGQALKTRAYIAWKAMLCRGRGSSSKEHYAERGITVCPQWHDFRNFIADMGPCPEKMTLDRKDNDLGYFPGNCRWATQSQQMRNTRSTVFLEYQGERISLSDLADRTGVHHTLLRDRLRRGLTPEEAVETPKHQKVAYSR